MKTLTAYQFSELNETAKFEADKGAVLYASQVMLASAEQCPATAVNVMFATARKEWLDGFFSESGAMRFPPSLFRDDVVQGGANDGAEK